MTVPDDMSQVSPVFELGGTIGRQASVECQQGQHDLCADPGCMCRHHQRHWSDVPHNHVTTAFRPPGECSACDAFRSQTP